MATASFSIKCGVLTSEDQVSPQGYKFFTWTVTTLPSSNSEEESLRERVKTFFPDVGDVFNVVCFDDDGDRIVLPIEDVKETIAALYSLKSKNSAKPVRLCIQPFDLREPGNCIGPIHFGVQCSNCTRKPITGFRYKCRQCPDYDLCGKCEAAGIHPEHDFTRISHQIAEDATAVVTSVSPSPDSMKRRPSFAQLAAIEQLGDRLIDQLTSLEQSLNSSLGNIATLLQGKEAGSDDGDGSMEELS